MQDHRAPPKASSLIESMRDIGYSFETALADIIDNSITAEASEIDIFCDADSKEPVIAILDNGRGMSRKKLLDAMRPGSQNPLDSRTEEDLGRFGLGLKNSLFFTMPSVNCRYAQRIDDQRRQVGFAVCG